ncbi:MAG: hypothetical protein RI967_1265 [Planctomycetota bacterium]
MAPMQSHSHADRDRLPTALARAASARLGTTTASVCAALAATPALAAPQAFPTYAAGSTVVEGERYYHTDVFVQLPDECDRVLMTWEILCGLSGTAGTLFQMHYPDAPASMRPLGYVEGDPLWELDSHLTIGGEHQLDTSGFCWITPDYTDSTLDGNGFDPGGIFNVPPVSRWNFAGPDRQVRLARFTLHEDAWTPSATMTFGFRLGVSFRGAGFPTLTQHVITVPFTRDPSGTAAAAFDTPSPEPFCWAEESGGGSGGGGGGGGGEPGDGVGDPPPGVARVGRTGFDFDLDGREDLLWHLPFAGNLSRWTMDGVTRLTKAAMPWSTYGGFEPLGSGDQSDDGLPEVFFHHPLSGWVVVWSFLGEQRTANPFLYTASPNWRPTAVADYTGDGRVDILERSTANPGVFRVRPLAYFDHFAPREPFALTAGHSYLATADLNGDGWADILSQAANGQVFVRARTPLGGMITTPVAPTALGSEWRFAGAADLDGDGDDDLVWHNLSTREVRAWMIEYGFRSAGAVVRTNIAPTFAVIAAIDTDGDGDDDLVWRNAQNGNVSVWRMNGPVREEGAPVANVPPAWRTVPR